MKLAYKIMSWFWITSPLTIPGSFVVARLMGVYDFKVDVAVLIALFLFCSAASAFAMFLNINSYDQDWK